MFGIWHTTFDRWLRPTDLAWQETPPAAPLVFFSRERAETWLMDYRKQRKLIQPPPMHPGPFQVRPFKE